MKKLRLSSIYLSIDKLIISAAVLLSVIILSTIYISNAKEQRQNEEFRTRNNITSQALTRGINATDQQLAQTQETITPSEVCNETALPYQTIYNESDKLPKGQREITEGKEGLESYCVNNLGERRVTKTIPPIDSVVTTGTYVETKPKNQKSSSKSNNAQTNQTIPNPKLLQRITN